ncbi:MAG: hypothetical protein ACFFCS_03605, partial [Candidatus Hodarchaeota archaeon]
WLNITVKTKPKSEKSDKYEVLDENATHYQNINCLQYNRTQQAFQYSQEMDYLLRACHGGYYVIPNDPVDVNIVKMFIESNTSYTATVQGNVVTIDMGNDQAILTYSDNGILTREELKVNGQLVKTLSIVVDNNNDLTTILIVAFSAAGAICVILVVYFKKRHS